MEKKTEDILLNEGYRKYSGNKIDVYFNKDICQHAGKCVKGDPETFNLERKPWILPKDERVEKIREVIDTCPSGALKYKLKEEEFVRP